MFVFYFLLHIYWPHNYHTSNYFIVWHNLNEYFPTYCSIILYLFLLITHICCMFACFDMWTFFTKEFVENTLRNLDIGILTWLMHLNAIFGEISLLFCHFFTLVFTNLDFHCFVSYKLWYWRCFCKVLNEFFNIFTN